MSFKKYIQKLQVFAFGDSFLVLRIAEGEGLARTVYIVSGL